MKDTVLIDEGKICVLTVWHQMTSWADNKERLAQQMKYVRGASTAAIGYSSNVARKKTKFVNEGIWKQKSMEIECGVRELLITSCQMMIWVRECCLLGRVRKRNVRRSWCWIVLCGNLAGCRIKWNLGNGVRQRRRRKTSPRSVFTAEARGLAPKMFIWKRQARELKPKRVSG